MSGSLSSGLHHARKDRGSGFCTFNGLVIAAKRALEAGATSVMILDLDANCGGGTASLIQCILNIRQMDVSVSGFDRYESTDNCKLVMLTQLSNYLPAIEHALNESMAERPGLVIYNAGMDPFKGCSTPEMAGITEETLKERKRMVFRFFRERGHPNRFCPGRRLCGAEPFSEGPHQPALDNPRKK